MDKLQRFVLSYVSNVKIRVQPGSFVGHRVFELYMSFPELVILSPYRWNLQKRCFQLNTKKWKRILAYLMALQFYFYIAWNVYNFFFAKAYQHSPLFSYNLFKILHFDVLLVETIALVTFSFFLFDPESVRFLNFIIRFDIKSGGKFFSLYYPT